MKIAITVWGNRISPVFDAASALLLVDLGDNAPLERDLRLFQPGREDSFIALLLENDVQLLICGAICAGAANRVENAGVEVVPFLTGEVESVIDGFIEKGDFTAFTMPGCRNGRCCRGKYKRGEGQQ